MKNSSDFISVVRKSARRKLLFLPHCVRQMSRPERIISTKEIKRVINQGKIIEDYPEDVRGHVCLIVGRSHNERVLHVVCSPKDDYLAIITAYVPADEEWEKEYSERRKK